MLPGEGIWPTIILERGYGESYDELVTGTDILLEGSEGRIGFAIVVWIQPLAAGEQEIQEGYVELHKYNKDTGKRESVGERQVIPPSPFPIVLSISVTNTFSATISRPTKPFYAMYQVELGRYLAEQC